MPTTTQEQGAPTPAWRSPWVIAWVGLVVVVLGVNLTMVYLAITTNPGLVSEDYYDRGQHYERTLISKLGKDPGWTIRSDIPADLHVDQASTIRVFLVDKAGQPVTPDAVNLFAYRPSDKAQDFSSVMTPEGPGRYVARVTFPLMGRWDTLVAVTQGEDEITRGSRINVAGP